MSFKTEILIKAHDEKNARRGYQLTRSARLPLAHHTLLFMYALRQHAQHLCPRVLTLACPSFLTAADIKGDVGATRG